MVPRAGVRKTFRRRRRFNVKKRFFKKPTYNKRRFVKNRRFKKRFNRRRQSKVPIINKYPVLRNIKNKKLVLKWADRRVLQKIDNSLLAGNMYKGPSLFSQLVDIDKPTEQAKSFLNAPVYCLNEVDAIMARYRFWRIKKLQLFITDFQITSFQPAQSTTPSVGPTRIGFVYHYDPAVVPTWGVDNPYIKWRTLPLKKPIKITWHPSMKGWFDQKIDDVAVHEAGNVQTGWPGQTYSKLKTHVASEWEKSAQIETTGPRTGESLGVVSYLNTFHTSSSGNSYHPNAVHCPSISNHFMPQLYWCIMPDFKVDPAQKYNYQLKFFQYVTLEMKQNTEMWNPPANIALKDLTNTTLFD